MATAEYNRAYYAKNRDKLLASMKARNKVKGGSYRATQRARLLADPEAAERKREQVRRWRKSNPEKSRGANRSWNERNRDRWFAALAQRNKRLKQATPCWADRVAIRAIYEEAKRLTRVSGTEYHVDHEIPLRGRNVSGLHVPANLRITTRAVNQAKANKFGPEPNASSRGIA